MNGTSENVNEIQMAATTQLCQCNLVSFHGHDFQVHTFVNALGDISGVSNCVTQQMESFPLELYIVHISVCSHSC